VKSVILTIAIFAALAPAAFAQQPATPWLTDAEQAKLRELRKAGAEALYNLEYDEATRIFKQIATLFPTHPAGSQFLAAGLWLKTLNESRRLQASLYNSEGFYKNADKDKGDEKIDPSIVSQFRELTRAAILRAQARLKVVPHDVDALYFLGSTEGLKAAFEAAVQRKFIGALRDGSSGVDHHREVIKLDPSYHDAELSIGFYDYIVGSLPLPVKILASVTGAHGSKRRGIETLQRVAKEGVWLHDDAKVLLIAVLKREKRYDEALILSKDLGREYPRNYLFKLESADALASIAAADRQSNRLDEAAAAEREAFALFDELLQQRAARSLDLIHFKYGESLLLAGQHDHAAGEFLASAGVAGAPSGLVTMAHLRAGQAYDLNGKRGDALAQYRAVLSLPDVYDAHDEAKQGLREPYKPKPNKGPSE
jgi:hypothetical protein